MASKTKSSVAWLNLFMEFIVVLIGILLAFQLNTCSATNKQKKIIASHLEQLDQETTFNKRSLERAIAYSENSLLKMDTLFHHIESRENVSVVNRLSLDLLDLGGVYIRKNAYQGLVESGDIRFMKDLDAKRDIIYLYEYYKWVEAFEAISTNLYSSDFYPYARDNFDLIGGKLQSEDIYYSKKYTNILGAYYRTSLNRVNKYKDCLQEVNSYLDELSEITE